MQSNSLGGLNPDDPNEPVSLTQYTSDTVEQSKFDLDIQSHTMYEP